MQRQTDFFGRGNESPALASMAWQVTLIPDLTWGVFNQ